MAPVIVVKYFKRERKKRYIIAYLATIWGVVNSVHVWIERIERRSREAIHGVHAIFSQVALIRYTYSVSL